MQFDLMKLFDGYVRNYHTFHLTVDHGKHSFTMTEIEYFSRLGSMLGYHAYTENMLIFRTYSQESDKNFFDKVYTYVFHKKKCVATKKAYISEVFGVLHMHE